MLPQRLKCLVITFVSGCTGMDRGDPERQNYRILSEINSIKEVMRKMLKAREQTWMEHQKERIWIQ